MWLAKCHLAHPLERIQSGCVISCRSEVVGALCGREEVDDAPAGVPEGASGSLGGLAQQRLELGEGLFDGVEVGTVGREVAQVRTRRLDHLAHARPLVARQVVHDDDVAGAQFRDQDLLDIGFEGRG